MDLTDPSIIRLEGVLPTDTRGSTTITTASGIGNFGCNTSGNSRPSSRLGFDGERPLTPCGDIRPGTPVHLKKAKRQAPKPPSKLTSGSGVDVTLLCDSGVDVTQSGDSGVDLGLSVDSSTDNSVSKMENIDYGHTNPHKTYINVEPRLENHPGRCSPCIPSVGYPIPGATNSHQRYHMNSDVPQVGGLSRVMLRLIDDEESDISESCSSAAEEARPIHVKLSASPIINPTSKPVTTSVASLLSREPSDGLNGIISPSNVSGDITVRRGRARRLMHSASDPGVSRGSMGIAYSRPPICTPTPPPPPLEQLSEAEEEMEYNTNNYTPYESELHRAISTGVLGESDHHRGARLQRSDSITTVAHLYEDLMVSPGLRVRVTLTNLTAVVILAAFVMPNTATLLYVAFRYEAVES